MLAVLHVIHPVARLYLVDAHSPIPFSLSLSTSLHIILPWLYQWGVNGTLKNPLYAWQSISCHTLSCHSPFLLKIPSAIGNMIPEKFLWNWFVVCDRCGSLDTVTPDPKELDIINIKTLSWRHATTEHTNHTHICQVHVSIHCHRVDCQVSARLISVKIWDGLKEREREREGGREGGRKEERERERESERKIQRERGREREREQREELESVC